MRLTERSLWDERIKKQSSQPDWPKALQNVKVKSALHHFLENLIE